MSVETIEKTELVETEATIERALEAAKKEVTAGNAVAETIRKVVEA